MAKKIHFITQAEAENPSYTYGHTPKFATVCGMSATKKKATTDAKRVNCFYCRKHLPRQPRLTPEAERLAERLAERTLRIDD